MVLTTNAWHERSGSVPLSHSTRFIHVEGIYTIALARVEARRSARPYRMRSHLINEEMYHRLAAGCVIQTFLGWMNWNQGLLSQIGPRLEVPLLLDHGAGGSDALCISLVSASPFTCTLAHSSPHITSPFPFIFSSVS